MKNPAILRRFSRLLAILVSSSTLAAHAEPVPSYRDPTPELGSLLKGPAMRNANLGPEQCRAQMNKAKLPHKRVYGGAKGIATPLRVTGALQGIQLLTAGPKSRFSLLDCRLLVTLNELAPLLAKHQVVRMQVDGFYRPNARLPGRKRKPSQHSYGLAMDVTQFKLQDGRVLDIERDFHGKIGEPVCGVNAVVYDATPEAIALRNLVCDIARSGLFHNILTPNRDQAHRNHLHFDIVRDARWFGIN